MTVKGSRGILINDNGSMSEQKNNRDFIQSIDRGFAVLLAFDADLPNPTLAEIATKTDLSRPAVRRILLTLQRLGYVAGHAGRWTLRPRVLAIGQHYAATNGLIELAQPHLLALAEHTQESASLAALDGIDVVYIARVQVRRIMSINVDVGTRLPAHATSMGRVLLAWAEPNQLEEVLGQETLERFTDRTITDPVRIRDDLGKVRKQGWSIVESELEPGLLSASAPVLNTEGKAVAALAYSTSVGRSTATEIEADVVPLLIAESAKISAELEQLEPHWKRTRPPARDGFF